MTNRLGRRIAALEAERTEDGRIRPVRIIGDTPPTADELARIESGAMVIHRIIVRPGEQPALSPAMTEDEWIKRYVEGN